MTQSGRRAQNFAVLRKAAFGSSPTRLLTHTGLDQRLAEYRELPTDDRRLFGFDEWLGPQVDVSVVRENADTGDYDRAQKANDYNFQMCSPVAGMHRVVHDGFCSG